MKLNQCSRENLSTDAFPLPVCPHESSRSAVHKRRFSGRIDPAQRLPKASTAHVDAL